MHLNYNSSLISPFLWPRNNLGVLYSITWCLHNYCGKTSNSHTQQATLQHVMSHHAPRLPQGGTRKPQPFQAFGHVMSASSCCKIHHLPLSQRVITMCLHDSLRSSQAAWNPSACVQVSSVVRRKGRDRSTEGLSYLQRDLWLGLRGSQAKSSGDTVYSLPLPLAPGNAWKAGKKGNAPL